MSVIFFGAHELANVAAICARFEGGLTNSGTLKVYADQLALISQANAACFRYRYHGEKRAPIEAAEIVRVASKTTVPNLADAVSTAALLHYNCQEDRDFLEAVAGGMAALADILNTVLFRLQDHAEEKRAL